MEGNLDRRPALRVPQAGESGPPGWPIREVSGLIGYRCVSLPVDRVAARGREALSAAAPRRTLHAAAAEAFETRARYTPPDLPRARRRRARVPRQVDP